MIPKVIHYVWVGDSPKSELILKCMQTWKKYLPDYQIVEWNNDSVASIDNKYLREAFESKKWAFVSDYLRLYALNLHGGFYFDTDLEVTQSIESFRNLDFVTGFELHEGKYSPITAMMGASADSKIIADLLSEYDSLSFIKNGSMNLETNTVRISRYLARNFNLKKPYNGKQLIKLDEKSIIYPYSHFCTREPNVENFSIHHFNASWAEDYVRKTIIQCGNIRFVAIKKIYNTGRDFPLFDNESLRYMFPLFFAYTVAIVSLK